MSAEFEKVQLSPSDGINAGYFTDGLPIAECIGAVVGVQVEYQTNRMIRRFGKVRGVHDRFAGATEDTLVETVIYFDGGDDLLLSWDGVKVALAEIAVEVLGD